MNERDIREKLKQVLRTALEDDTLQLDDAMTGWDSVTYINLVVLIERSFGISLTTKEIHQMTNVGSFVRTLVDRLGPDAGPPPRLVGTE